MQPKLTSFWIRCFAWLLVLLAFCYFHIYLTLLSRIRSHKAQIEPHIYDAKSFGRFSDPLSRFKRIHEEILTRKRDLKVSINGLANCGYANKLYSMLSSLVIALLTDSAFIVRWNHISLFIDEPFNGLI
jgi:hypothetical protein